MQYTYLMMLVAATVSAGPIGIRSTTPGYQSIARGLPPSTSPFAPGESLSDSPLPPPANMQCHFVAPGSSSATPNTNPPIPNPQAPLVDTSKSSRPNTASTIPSSAWQQVSIILSKITSEKQNTMQTWDLGRALNDNTLEGVMLGVVYSSQSTKEGMNVASPESRVEVGERRRRECVQSAVLEVESKRQMEGALDLPVDEEGNGGGRASFLVYRVD